MHARPASAWRRGLVAAVSACAAALAPLPAPAPLAAAPLAGTAIPNVAAGAGVDSTTGASLQAWSDTVLAIVAPLEALTLAPPRAATVPAGGAVTFAHRLTNTGNVTSDVRIDVANLTGDGFDLTAVALWQDLDGDGVLGPLDPPLLPGGTLSLAAGEHRDLLVTAGVPASAAAGAEAWLRLSAITALQSANAWLADTARVAGGLTPPALAFYADDTYALTIRRAHTGDPLFLEAAAPACDLDPLAPDSVRLAVASSRTGDLETFVAVETGARTGRFRVQPFVPVVQVALGSGTSVAGRLEVTPNDHITATLAGCGGTLTRADLWLDAAGTVVDALTDQPVAGARVRLIDVTGGGNGGLAGDLARVFDWDGVTPAAAEVVTGADGRYAFPSVAPSTYRIAVACPPGHQFPSDPALPVNPARLIDPAASYGADFTVADAATPVVFDLPCVPVEPWTLFAEKTASRAVVEPGDVFDYTVRVANRSARDATGLVVRDQLPPGFAYVPGTARRDGAAFGDPDGGGGPALAFALGGLGAGVETRVTYRVRVGAAVPLGDAVNRAIAVTADTSSNEATARVTVVGGPFADEATVTGTVFVDRDGDRRAGAGDPGMPGVRIYADDGTFAITDPNGRYSLYGLTPRTHALKVDAATLPAGARLVAADHRDGDRAGVRFVDLQRGDLQRADFVIAADSVSVPAIEVRERLRAGAVDEVGRSLRRPLRANDDPLPPGDPRALPTSGLLTGEGRLPLAEGGGAAQVGAGAGAGAAPGGLVASLDPRGTAGGKAAPLEALLAGADPWVAFIEPIDGDTLHATQTHVRVKGAANLAFTLSVNGQPVPESRVGRRVAIPERGLAAWEYVGVPLRPGRNLLEVAQSDSSGVVRGIAHVAVVAPDRLGRLVLTAPRGVPADGHGAALVRVRALDSRGVPVPGRLFVTLESSAGVWHAEDLDPELPGLQVAIVDGEAEVPLGAPSAPAHARVRARASDATAELELDFEPELRPLVVVGVAEGVLSLDHLRHGPGAVDRARTGFEQPIGQFFDASADGRGAAGARAALFAKGRVSDDVLLTLGYDSDRPSDLRRFRDIQSDPYYPILGDGSVKGFEAQSTGRLFARVDRRGASLLYGDFLTGGAGGSRSLTTYARSLTGAATHWEDGRVRVDAFSSRERSRRRIDELPGRGISGPYTLAVAPLVENSEQVELLVRDRNQPSVVLQARIQQRFADYELDALAGQLLFKAPVPSLDADLNPISIRVTYEVRGGGEPAWVNGTDARVKVRPNLELGGTYVDDKDPENPFELRGAFAGVRAGASTTIEGEWATTHRPGVSSGDGGRVELRHESAGANGRLYAAVTDSAFANPGSGFGPGRAEVGTRWDVRLAERTRLVTEGLYSGDVRADERRGGLLMSVAQGLSPWSRGELGVRAAGARRRGLDPEPDLLTVRAKLLGQLPRRPELSGYLEGEQDVRERDRRLLAAGGEYRFESRGRLYLRHELISSLSGAYSLDAGQRRLATVLGVDADVPRATHVFSEYRLADAISGRQAEAAIGLRNQWRVDEHYRVATTFERVEALRGGTPGPATALTGAIETVEDEPVRASGRVEVRSSRASDAFLASLGLASRLDSSWTLLGRTVLHVTDERARGVTERERLQLGVAYRAAGTGWDALGRYELRFDREPLAALAPHRRVANVVTLNTSGPLAEVVDASLAWAGKVVQDRGEGLITATHAQWVRGRVREDLGRRWDIGLSASARFGERMSAVSQGYGIELGRRLGHDLWASAGWNWWGYDDPELTGDDYTRAGAYVRLRAKFDESLFVREREVTP